jgi:hypothetical protein
MVNSFLEDVMSTVSSKKFNWFADRRIFISEMSELPAGFRFEQIYPDACDAGFRMVSHRTGEEVKFAMSATDMNGDEVAGWRFEPTRDCIRRNPRLAGISCLIIND